MGFMNESEFNRACRAIREAAQRQAFDNFQRQVDEHINRMFDWTLKDSETVNEHGANYGKTHQQNKRNKTPEFLPAGYAIAIDGKGWVATRDIQIKPKYNPGPNTSTAMSCINGIYIESVTKYPKH